jgi:hypothetical protein
MKNLALLILAAGIGISASYGARLAPELHDQMVIEGRAKFLQEATDALHTAYCDARGEADLSAADGCGEHELTPPAVDEDATAAEYRAAWEAHIAQLRGAEAELVGEVATLRTAWLDALSAQVGPSAEASVLVPPPPGSRVGSWFDIAGLMFLFGLVLIVVGAILGRRAVKAEALAAAPEGAEGEPPKDFGELLDALATEIGGIADRIKGIDAPEVTQFEEIKSQVEELQVGMFHPLIESRARVQARYGMAGFAEIFGPLSAAERKMNRSWAALVDRHWGESKASVLGAHTEIIRAQDALAGAVKSTG